MQTRKRVRISNRVIRPPRRAILQVYFEHAFSTPVAITIGPNVPALFNVIRTLSFHLFVILRCCRLQFQFKSDLALALALALVHGIVLVRVPPSLLLVRLEALLDYNPSECSIGLPGVARFEFFGDPEFVLEEGLQEFLGCDNGRMSDWGF
ncbi:hypothetical protein FPRO04_13262 [Fusarium proliferatum]|nr:hypothetical protein FPRO04_13262 [Fusarium proliferatum]